MPKRWIIAWIWAAQSLSAAAMAGTMYWDTSTAGGLQAGGGVWNTSAAAQWSDSTDGSSPLLTWTNGNDDADFNASGASSISLSGIVTARSVTLDGTGYSLSGGTLYLNSGSVTANRDGSIGSILAGAGLTKSGTATLTLRPPATNVYSAATQVMAGTLLLDMTGLPAPTDPINPTSRLVLGGGVFNPVLSIRGGTAGTSSQSFIGMTLKTGQSAIRRDTQGVINVSIGGVTRHAGGAMDFGSGSVTVLTTSLNDGSTGTGILGGWATFGDDWAVKGSAGTAAIVAYDHSSYTSNVSPWFETQNMDIVQSGQWSSLESARINSLRFNHPTAGTLTVLGVRSIATGGILIGSSAADRWKMTGGTLMSGNGMAMNDLIITQQNDRVFEIATAIADNSGLPTHLTKGGTGAGTLLLSGANSFTGDLYVNSGTVELAPPADWNYGGAVRGAGGFAKSGSRTLTLSGEMNLGGACSVNGGGLVASGTLTCAGGVIVQSGGTLTIGNANALAGAGPLTVGGVVDIGGLNPTNGSVTLAGGNIVDKIGGGSLSSSVFTVQAGTASARLVGGGTALVKTTSGAATISGSNTYGGGTTINGGVLNVSVLANGGYASGLGQSGYSAANLVLGGGTLQYIGSGGSTDRLLRLNGGTSGLGASGSGPVSFTNSGSIDVSVGGAFRTLVLTGDNPGNNTFAARLADYGGGYTTSLVKAGGGKWILTGTNGYSGGTTVTGGTLLAGSASALGSSASALTVSGGVLDLGGYNRTAGSVTVAGGLLTGGSLTLTGGSYSLQAGTISAGLNGSGIALNKTTAGQAVLSGADTTGYSGGTYVAAGVLDLMHQDALRPGTRLALTGGTVGFGPWNPISSGTAGRLPAALQIGKLDISGGTAPVGQLDLRQGAVVIDGGQTSYADVKAWIKAGYNNRQLDGLGITSSVATSDTHGSPPGSSKMYGVGYARNADLRSGVAQFTTWFGRPVADTATILLRYTVLGDATMDGKADLNDYYAWRAGYTQKTTVSQTWVNGDFNYDSKVDLNDYYLWRYSYLAKVSGLGGYATATDGLAVPEPCSLMLLAAGGSVLMLRAGRRRLRVLQPPVRAGARGGPASRRRGNAGR